MESPSIESLIASVHRVALPLAAGAFGALLLSDAIHPLGLVLLQLYLAF